MSQETEEIKEKLIELETKFNERWDSQERDSKEFRTYIKCENNYLREKIEKISQTIIDLKLDLKGLPCNTHLQMILNHDKTLLWIWGFISSIVLSILFMFLKYVNGI